MAKEQKVLTYSESISAVASLVLLAMTNQPSQPAVGGGDSLVAKSCLTLCNPMDCSLPGSSLSMGFPRQEEEWVAISFSRASSQTRGWTRVSCLGRWILYH